MTIPAGFDREQIEWNVYAFGADVRKFTRKRDAARKDHTRTRWQKKVDEYTIYLNHNKEWLAELNASPCRDLVWTPPDDSNLGESLTHLSAYLTASVLAQAGRQRHEQT